jgi:hypothetical protein
MRELAKGNRKEEILLFGRIFLWWALIPINPKVQLLFFAFGPWEIFDCVYNIFYFSLFLDCFRPLKPPQYSLKCISSKRFKKI